MTDSEAGLTCSFALHVASACGPQLRVSAHPLQTLNELDAAVVNDPAAEKTSWTLLSRVGVNFLASPSATGCWTICYNHRRQLLDTWQPDEKCCGHSHVDTSEKAPCQKTVSASLISKILQLEGKVLPRGGKLCSSCAEAMNAKYCSDKNGKTIVVSPTANWLTFTQCDSLSVPSPFVKQECPPREMPTSIITIDASSPTLTLKAEVVDTDEPEDSRPSSSCSTFSSIFSEDSDDDRTWLPSKRGETDNKRKHVDDDEDEDGALSARKSPPKKAKKTPPKSTDDGGEHHFCAICKITFYKRASYRQHMRSSKQIHSEIKSKAQVKLIVFRCFECDLTFSDGKEKAAHMEQKHGHLSAEKQFYCTKCDVQLKSESAFKSHNSKLHLERRRRTYYCRECDETFSCKLKHAIHIKSHVDAVGLQCRTCGKVFLATQVVPYQRHQSTHEAEPEEECNCKDCAFDEVANSSVNGGDVRHKKGKSKSQPESDNGVLCVAYACARCKETFTQPSLLERHVQSMHASSVGQSGTKTKEEEGEDVNEEDDEEDQSASGVATLKGAAVCQSRNWAAEFGYGKTKAPASDLLSRMKLKFKGSNGAEASESVESAATTAAAESVPGPRSFDVIGKMRSLFKDNDAVEDEEDEDDGGEDNFEAFRTRGFKGTAKASPKRSPRTLSLSSLLTRKRMESLVKRAQALRENNERERAEKAAAEKSEKAAAASAKDAKDELKSKESEPAAVEASPVLPAEETKSSEAEISLETEVPHKEPTIVAPPKHVEEEEEEEDDDDDIDGIEDDDEGLLIPLANGWVCEKKLSANRQTYSTSFWSPAGSKYCSLSALREMARRKKLKLDLDIFEKALKKNPKRNGAGRGNKPKLSDIVQDIIAEEEEMERRKISV